MGIDDMCKLICWMVLHFEVWSKNGMKWVVDSIYGNGCNGANCYDLPTVHMIMICQFIPRGTPSCQQFKPVIQYYVVYVKSQLNNRVRGV